VKWVDKSVFFSLRDYKELLLLLLIAPFLVLIVRHFGVILRPLFFLYIIIFYGLFFTKGILSCTKNNIVPIVVFGTALFLLSFIAMFLTSMQLGILGLSLNTG